MNINVSNVKHNQFNVHNMKISETKASIPISTAAPSKKDIAVGEDSHASSVSVYDTDLAASLTISERAKEAILKFPFSNMDESTPLMNDSKLEAERPARELVSDYSDIISGDELHNCTNYDLNSIFNNALKLYEEIENGPDDEQTKAIKRAAFEEALKYNVDGAIAHVMGYQGFIDDMHMEQDPTISRRIGTFNAKQNIAISNSMHKLAINFLNYLKNSKTYDYASMIKYANKDSTNTRDINNLSLSEVNSYIDYAEKSKYRFSFSNSDVDFFNGYFSTVSNQDSFLSDNEWRFASILG